MSRGSSANQDVTTLHSSRQRSSASFSSSHTLQLSWQLCAKIFYCLVLAKREEFPNNCPIWHSDSSCHLVQSHAALPRGGRGCCTLAPTNSCRPLPPWKGKIRHNREKKNKLVLTDETVDTRLMSSRSSIPSLDGASSSANASLSSPGNVALSAMYRSSNCFLWETFVECTNQFYEIHSQNL